jgi:hypothetical protein
MTIRHRVCIVAAMASTLLGCSQYGPSAGLDRAEPLGIQRTEPLATPTDRIVLDTNLPQLPPLAPPDPLSPESYQRQYRDSFVEQWMARSDILCRQYKDKIILVSRDTRFATDASTTLLSGLATIFKSLSVVHPLTGAATIIGGVGAAADSDFFQRQSGEIIASAIETARHRQANQIEKNLKKPALNLNGPNFNFRGSTFYSIYRAQRDVTEYHNMCSLETGLKQIRASLQAIAPDQGNTPPAAQGEQRSGVEAGALQLQLQLQQPEPEPPPPLPPPPPQPPIFYTPPRPTDKVTEKTVRKHVVVSPDLLTVFDGPGRTEKDLRNLQAAFCIPRNERGRVNQATIANVNLIVNGTERPMPNTARISDRPGPGNYAEIVRAAGGAGAECDTARYHNYYENSKYRAAPAEEAALLNDMQQFLSPGATTPPPTTLKDGRNLVKSMREACGLPTTGLFADELTPDLESKFAANRCKSPVATPPAPASLAPAPLAPAPLTPAR